MKLRLNQCDEVNHGGDRYVVSNVDQTYEVPDHVGHILLRVGAATRFDTPDEPEPEGFVMSHADRGEHVLPRRHAAEAVSHSFLGPIIQEV